MDDETKQSARRPVVHVRVQAATHLVECVATQIGELLEGAGYEVIEQSAPYPSRNGEPEARVFLTVR